MSDPRQADDFTLATLCCVILLQHNLVSQNNAPSGYVQPRMILWQILACSLRRARRINVNAVDSLLAKTSALCIFKEPGPMQHAVEMLHLDLAKRIGKQISNPSAIYCDRIAFTILSVLSFFYQVNDKLISFRSGGALPAATFYSAAVNGELDVRADYLHWQQLSKQSNDSSCNFAFCQFPWIWDLDRKSDLLKISEGVRQRHQVQDAFFRALFNGVQSTQLQLTIRRAHLLADTLRQIDRKPVLDLTKPLKIQFAGEEGIDEGGLVKEFFAICWQDLFKMNMFREITLYNHRSIGVFWFNTRHPASNAHQFRLAGLLLGLAIYNSVLLPARLPILLIRRLLGWPVCWEDYEEIDAQLVASVAKIEQMHQEGFDIASLSLYFEVDGADLIPGGGGILVTNQNCSAYITALKDHHLHDCYAAAFAAFQTGFRTVCSMEFCALYSFRPEEVADLMFGSVPETIDISQLKQIAVYEGGFSSGSGIVQWFWAVVGVEFSQEELRALLQFATGSDRIPTGGLRRLGSFIITRLGDDCECLPTARTCFNCLQLWDYHSKEKLGDKLRLAIQHNFGFGLV